MNKSGNSSSGTELEPCRHCGTETTQRAEGIPYCSMDCIGGRRRFLKEESIECPYPGCDWETRYLPKNNLSRIASHREAEEHREEHRQQLEDTSTEETQ